MSDINGKGHGDAHDWRAGFTPASRQTPYTCRVCGAKFWHDYNHVPNIFDAMKRGGVPLECVPEAAKGAADE